MPGLGLIFGRWVHRIASSTFLSRYHDYRRLDSISVIGILGLPGAFAYTATLYCILGYSLEGEQKCAQPSLASTVRRCGACNAGSPISRASIPLHPVLLYPL